MMNLLLLNDSYFGDTLEDGDVHVLRVGPGPDNDLVVDPDRDDISELIAELPFHPHAVLQVDSINRRVFFKGLEKIDAPRAFYAIDTPINSFWQQDFAHLFDRVWIDQPQSLEEWREANVSWASWLPLAADRSIFYPPANDDERDLDIVFVGTMDPERRPKRTAILHRLRQIADVTLVDGGGTRSVPPEEVADYYRRARIVLNELLFDGVNLRTFEVMATGATLLTEAGRGHESLFEDGHHLVTFDATNLEEVVLDLLEDDARREAIGQNGAEVIRTGHSIGHRARGVIRELKGLRRRPERNSSRSQALGHYAMWFATWKWEGLDELRHRAAETVVDLFEELDLDRQTIFLEGVGQARQASEYLKNLLDTGAASPSLKPALASLALAVGDQDTAREMLDMPDAGPVDLHLAVGDRLCALGRDLSPGFNREHAPRSSWSAFEHYSRAYALDNGCRAALEGLDRVLLNHHSPEFMLPLWQRFHSRNPRQDDIKRLLIQRARSGYLMPGHGAEARRHGRPFTRPRRPENLPPRVGSRGTPRR